MLHSMINHQVLGKLIKLLDTSQFHNVVLRLLQFLIKLTHAKFLQKDSPNIAIFKQLEYLVKFLRKPLKAATIPHHLKTILLILSDELTVTKVKLGLLLKELSFIGFLVCELISFMKQSGLVSRKKFNRVDTIGFKCWSMSLMVSILLQLRNMRVASLRKANIEQNFPKEGKRELIEREKLKMEASRSLFVRCFMNLGIALNGSKVVKLDDGVIAGLGIVTSFVNLKETWKKAGV
ncbi:unnamed protein product [Ambrosiozyma monospora]|uniref:Unnamed protein product n=1 Tax=Ambrosiozyma monospora TaxID=43982 RepID=A0ACB5T3W5_AMBMO|nr:unnamed protein product [Ambrosiozyma monospora]